MPTYSSCVGQRHSLLNVVSHPTQGCRSGLSYHVESDHIAERYFASFVALNKVLVDQDGAASRGQAEDEGLLWRWIESSDAFYARPLEGFVPVQGGQMCTNDIVRNVLGRSLRIISNN
jgi:hypothetical protein